MLQGFVFFHAARNHQRHLLIVYECLSQQIEDQKNGQCGESEPLSDKSMRELVSLSESMTADMEKFIWNLYQNQDCLKTAQQFIEAEHACHQLLNSSLSIVHFALDISNGFGFDESIISQLRKIAARTNLIQSRLRDYVGTS